MELALRGSGPVLSPQGRGPWVWVWDTFLPHTPDPSAQGPRVTPSCLGPCGCWWGPRVCTRWAGAAWPPPRAALPGAHALLCVPVASLQPRLGTKPLVSPSVSCRAQLVPQHIRPAGSGQVGAGQLSPLACGPHRKLWWRQGPLPRAAPPCPTLQCPQARGKSRNGSNLRNSGPS